MPTFEQGAIVKIPFPYADRTFRQSRPALVISTNSFARRSGLLSVLMITSAKNRAWPDDVPVPDFVSAGLPIPSVIQTAKVATVQVVDAEHLGEAPNPILIAALAAVREVVDRQEYAA